MMARFFLLPSSDGIARSRLRSARGASLADGFSLCSSRPWQDSSAALVKAFVRCAQVAVSGGGGSSNNGGSGSSTSSTSTRGGSSTRSSSSGTAGATSGASNTGAAVQASTARLGSIGALLAVVVGAAALF